MPPDDPIASPSAQSAPTPEPIPFPAPPPATPPKTGRAVSSPINAKLGGNRKGTQHRDKARLTTPVQVEAAIEATAMHVLKGGSPIRPHLSIGPLSVDDKAMLARVAGISADEYFARLNVKLRSIADKTAERIAEHLEANTFKPSDLTWLMATTVDKMKILDGKLQLANASVNVQINNFGPRTREEVIAALTGQLPDVPATPQPQSVPASSPDLSTTATPITLEAIITPTPPDPSPESHDAKTPSN